MLTRTLATLKSFVIPVISVQVKTPVNPGEAILNNFTNIGAFNKFGICSIQCNQFDSYKSCLVFML